MQRRVVDFAGYPLRGAWWWRLYKWCPRWIYSQTITVRGGQIVGHHVILSVIRIRR